MVLYNVSWANNATNPAEIIVGIGSSIGSEFLIGNLMLLAFFFIFMALALKQRSLEVTMIGNFILVIIAMLLAFAGMVSFLTITIPAIVFFIALVIYFFS